MKINVVNKTRNLNIAVSEAADGVTIQISEMKETLGSVPPGNIVTIGGHRYIVLGHAAETTALLHADRIGEGPFDDCDGDYETSDIRKYINGDYYKALCAVVGKEKVIRHRVSLEADDGTNKGAFCKDFVSLITTANYRRYREYIPAVERPWWTATRETAVTPVDIDYARGVCIVGSCGILCRSGCDCRRDIRPFCILDSSVVIS